MVPGALVKEMQKNSLTVRIRLILCKCLEEGKAPLWMMKGRTLLIQKDRCKGTAVSNYNYSQIELWFYLCG